MLCSAVAVAYLLICLSIYLFISLSFCLPIFLSLSLSLSIYLSIYLSVCLSACLSVCLSICLYLSVSIYLSRSICLSIYLSIHPSIYIPANLKTKLFCETSSVFEFGNIKNDAILQDFLQKWRVAPKLRCFVRFDFQMCFVPQRRALFQHLNFQKWSGVGVFCIFWVGNVLRATTAQFFISHMTTWLCTRRFNEPTFRPSGHKSLEKHSVSRLSYLFAHLNLLSSHFFSSLIFSLLLFSSLTLATSAFPSVHIVGSLTSKLPSINNFENIDIPKF